MVAGRRGGARLAAHEAMVLLAAGNPDGRGPSGGCPVGQVVLGGSGTFMACPGVTPVFRWTQLSGPAAAVLSSAKTAYPQAGFPVLDTYRFQLTLNDRTSNGPFTVSTNGARPADCLPDSGQL